MTRLIEGAASWHKLWSVRIAALAGTLASYLIAFPDQRDALLELIPDGPLRVLAAFAIGLLVFAVPTAARLTSQTKKESDDDA